jgi:beta-N-acetylhexosaminidase
VNQIKAENSSNLPLFLSVDQEGGRVTRLPGELANFPSNKQIGEVNNPIIFHRGKKGKKF